MNLGHRLLVGTILYYTPPSTKHKRNISLPNNRVAGMKNKGVTIGLSPARTPRENARNKKKEKRR